MDKRDGERPGDQWTRSSANPGRFTIQLSLFRRLLPSRGGVCPHSLRFRHHRIIRLARGDGSTHNSTTSLHRSQALDQTSATL